MKAKVTKADLLAALERVTVIVSADILLLKNVLIEAKDGRISLATTNLAEFVSTSCLAEEVQQEGKALVNVQKLTEVVKGLPKGTLIEFSLKEKLTLKGSGFRCSLITSPLDSFPAFPAGEDNLFVMKAKVLKEVLERAVPFAGDGTSAMFINGVLFQKAGEKIVAVATDTHRMSVVEKEKAVNASSIIPEKGVLIPKDGIRALLKLFDGFHKGAELAEIDVAVGFNGEMCTFKTEDTVLKVRLFEGNFPDYKRIIPSHDKTFMVNRERLISALTRMKLMDKTVNFKGSGDTLTISSNDSLGSGGDAEETLEVDGLRADFSTAFNSKYLTEALSLMNGNEKVIFGFTIENAGFTLTPEKMDGFTHIIMPCRSH